jgi:prolyl-tRNA synthetase
VVYQKASDNVYVIVFLRGDLDVNETKLKNILMDNIHPAVIMDESGLNAGYIGPYGLRNIRNITVLYDNSLMNTRNLCCGANKTGYHYTGFSINRDGKDIVFHDLAKAVEGGICPQCKQHDLLISRGIEVGNIFQLDTKYTKAMEMQYTDQNGELHYPIMGCYGVGVGRLAAAVCEARHDEYGPIWPLSIAPWQVHICCVRADDALLKIFADKLYNELQSSGVEIIYDDRLVSAGVMFADADLIGVPVRVIVSPRNMEDGSVEIVTRDKKINKKVKTDEAAAAVKEILRELSNE